MKSYKYIIKYIFAFITLLAIVYLGFIFYKWYHNKSLENNSHSNESIENRINEKLKNKTNYKYKNLEFNFSDNVEFSNIDDYKFKVDGADYEAYIEVFIDENDQLINNLDDYYNLLIKNDIDVQKSDSLIDNNTIFYKKSDNNNSLLYYYAGFPPYSFEIEMHNDDNSFSINNLKNIIDDLRYTIYQKDDSNKEFLFHSFNMKDDKLIADSKIEQS